MGDETEALVPAAWQEALQKYSTATSQLHTYVSTSSNMNGFSIPEARRDEFISTNDVPRMAPWASRKLRQLQEIMDYEHCGLDRAELIWNARWEVCDDEEILGI
jgi:hypothetical protein